MKRQEYKELRQFSELVGDFIRYWGFRKIHGEIWATIYLSEQDLSGMDLVECLGVSKALVSPALKELEREGLIVSAPSENSKTKRYQAVEDVQKVIRDVLRRREKVLIEEIGKSFEVLKATNHSGLRGDRLEKVGAMVLMADLTLSGLLASEDLWV